jgi:hypothetical protein
LVFPHTTRRRTRGSAKHGLETNTVRQNEFNRRQYVLNQSSDAAVASAAVLPLDYARSINRPVIC